MPASLALIAHDYPEPAERTRAVAAWAACAGAGFATGPVLGGILVNQVGWRAIFLVNLPVGVVALALLLRNAIETARSERGIDVPGQLLGIASLGAVAFGLTEAGTYGWSSPLTLVPLVIAVLTAGAFVATELRVASPLLPPALLSHRSFSAAVGVGLILNFGIYGQVFVLSLYLQQVRHFTALDTGLMLLPFAGLTMVLPPVTGRIVARVGPRYLMTTGQCVMAAGTAILALAGQHTAYLQLLPGLVLLGLGMAATMPSMTAAVMLAAPREFAGIASGVLNAARQVGGVLGIALLGTLIAGSRDFIPGMHPALGIVVGAFLTGAALSALWAPRPQRAQVRAASPRSAAVDASGASADR